MIEISIIIPTYEEKDNVVPLIRKVDGSLKMPDYETTIIDDDSNDSTIERVNELKYASY